MAEKTLHLTILILQLCGSFTNKLTTIINQLIKPLANIYHPFCKADEAGPTLAHFQRFIVISRWSMKASASKKVGTFLEESRHLSGRKG